MRLLAPVFNSLFCCSAALFLLGVPVFGGTVYCVTTLGALGSGSAQPTAFSSAGAVGFATTATGEQSPGSFGGGVSTMLGGIGAASGINASGTVIGTTFSGGQSKVTEWAGGTAKDLGIAGFGQAINDAGQIAGARQVSGGQLHAFVMTNGLLTDLGAFSGGFSTGMAINSGGQVAGSSSMSDQSSHAFFWNGAAMRDLGTLGGANSYAMALNNVGEVAGAAQTREGYLNAFAWTSAGMVDLGTLGGTTSAAYGVNKSGEVVGYSLTSGNATTHGFLDLNGVMLDLNELLPAASGWEITGAFALDDLGDILATGTYQGQTYAVEMSPSLPSDCGLTPLATPEPRSLLLAGVGLILFARLGRRKPKSLS